MENITLNWSSGKDAALAFYYLQQEKKFRVQSLLTTLSAQYNRVSMHGIREELLELQAAQMNIPLQKIYLPENADMETYNGLMQQAVTTIQQQGTYHLAFGDLFLEDLRLYREKQLATAGMTAVFPLWKKDTAAMVQELEDTGIEALLVCVNDRYLDKSFLGRRVNRELLRDLPPGVDPCGENGEYHSLVLDAPFFREKLKVKTGEIIYQQYESREEDKWDSGFYFLDVIPEQ